MFAWSLVDFLSLLWSPSTNIDLFLFLSKVSFEGHTQTHPTNSSRKSYKSKTWMRFVGKYWLSWELLPLRFSLVAIRPGNNLCKHAGGHSVPTESRTSPQPTWLGLCGMKVWKLIGATCAMYRGVPLHGKVNAMNTKDGNEESIWACAYILGMPRKIYSTSSECIESK